MPQLSLTFAPTERHQLELAFDVPRQQPTSRAESVNDKPSSSRWPRGRTALALRVAQGIKLEEAEAEYLAAIEILRPITRKIQELYADGAMTGDSELDIEIELRDNLNAEVIYPIQARIVAITAKGA